MLVINALTASAAVLIPVLPDYLAVGGLSLFLQTVERVKTRKLNPRLQVADLVLTMTAVQTAHDREYIPQLEALATARASRSWARCRAPRWCGTRRRPASPLRRLLHAIPPRPPTPRLPSASARPTARPAAPWSAPWWWPWTATRSPAAVALLCALSACSDVSGTATAPHRGRRRLLRL